MLYLLMQPDHSRQLLMIPCDTIVSTEGKVMQLAGSGHSDELSKILKEKDI